MWLDVSMRKRWRASMQSLDPMAYLHRNGEDAYFAANMKCDLDMLQEFLLLCLCICPCVFTDNAAASC